MVDDITLLGFVLASLLIVIIFSQINYNFFKGSLNQTDKYGRGKRLPPKLPIGIFDLLRLGLNPKTNFAQVFAGFGLSSPVHMIRSNWPRLRVLIINDLEVAKDLFQNSVFSDRPVNEFWRYHAKGNYGIVTSSGKVWEEQRRFTLRKLKDAGMGNQSMEALIATEVEDFIGSLEADAGKVISPNKRTSVPFFNTLWVLLTGERFNHADSSTSSFLLGVYEGFMRILELPQIFLLAFYKEPISVATMTKLRKWFAPYFLPGLNVVESGFDNLREFCVKLIDQRKQNLEENRNDVRASFIDDYLQEIEGTTNEKSTFYKEEGVKNLIATIADLFIASGETAANTLSWSMLHLIRNPEVQHKIQAELDTIVGRERRPGLSDIPNCPYTFAFVNEVLRLTPASLFSLPHVTTKDVDIGGDYFVEKNTTVILNIAAVHGDPKLWTDPDHFRPERFLSPDGTSFVKNGAMVAFSIGKRKCPAMHLGLNTLFMFVSAICQQFRLTKDPNLDGWPPLAPELSGLNTPKPFFMHVELRT